MPPVGVPERQPLETQELDETALVRPAQHGQQLQAARGHHLGGLGSLPRARQVVETAGGAVQVPLSGVAQGLEHIVVVIVGQLRAVGADQGRPAWAGHDDPPRAGVNRGQRRTFLDPEVQVDDFDVAQVAESANVAGGGDKLRLPALAPTRRQGKPRRRLHAEQPLGRPARTGGAAAIHIQLAELPLAGRNLGQLGDPGVVAVHAHRAPAGDPAAAVEHRLLATPRGKGHGVGVLRAEDDRFVELVAAAAHPYGERLRGCRRWHGRLALGAEPLELAHPVARPGQRGQRAVALRRVGRRQPSGPRVVPVGGNEQLHG
ncbi:MAG: hypothetical protein BWZ02_03381 [Lentisphaerae bacterium ADurb.BinA184]|nr:MAG: hypothetical protein BWZ02_03381 [Lentisphaerae bacterium ADurb.BinA184]